MLPTFIGVGAMKSGTTTLAHLLDAHKDVYLAPQKELRFFSHDENWSRGRGWYESAFEASGGARAVGEYSPAYSQSDTYPDAARRMAATCPDVRLIYLVRDPIARIRSHFLNDVRSGRILDADIDTAVRTEPRFLECSQYAKQVAHLLDYFDEAQLLIVTTEKLESDPHDVLARAFAHIGVDPTFRPADLETRLNNSRAVKRRTRPALRRIRRTPLVRAVVRRLPTSVRDVAASATSERFDPTAVGFNGETRRWLAETLAPDVSALKRYVSDDFDGWGLA